jgi:hypothetical protein
MVECGPGSPVGNPITPGNGAIRCARDRSPAVSPSASMFHSSQAAGESQRFGA